MRTNLFIALMGIVFLSSCSRNDVECSFVRSTVTLVAKNEVTRTELDGGNRMIWSADDKVDINGEEYAASAGGSSTEFAGVTEAPSYTVVYPSALYDFSTKCVKIPVAQRYAANSFANNTVVMAGYSESRGSDMVTVRMKSAYAYIKMNFSADIDKIILESNAGEAVTGIFKLNVGEDIVEMTAVSGQNALHLTEVSGRENIVIAVPAQNYSRGLRLILKSGSEYRKADMWAGSGIELLPNKIYDVTSYELNLESCLPPSATLISTAEEFNAWLADPSSDAILVEDIEYDASTNGAFSPCAELNATLDGQCHSIKNWVNAGGAGLVSTNKGIIKNIVIDSSCSVTGITSGTANVAMIAILNHGIINGCVNCAPINFNITEPVSMATGAICAAVQNSGVIEDCINRGDITISYTDRDSKTVYQGGIVGRMNTPSYGTRILRCVNEGDMSVTITATAANKDKGHCFTGGILAASTINAGTAGTSESCYTNYYGDVDNCMNTGNVTVSRPDGGTSAYIKTGGLIAYIEGSVRNCINHGDVTYTSSTSKSNAGAAVAGVVASMAGPSAELAGCSNTGNVRIEGYFSNAAAAYASTQVGFQGMAVAGVAALVGDQASSISDCSNEGSVVSSTKGITHYVGGVIGVTRADISSCRNTGTLVYSDNAGSSCNGGVIGACMGDKIDNCVNGGTMRISGASTTVRTAGGIVGSIEADTSVTDCTNTAEVGFEAIGNTNTVSYLGGIVGYGAGTSPTIERCSNHGGIASLQSNFTDVYAAGLCGFFNGAISECENTGDISVGNVTDSFVGGLSGYCSKGITGCSVSGNISVKGMTSTAAVGGIVAATVGADMAFDNVYLYGSTDCDNPSCSTGFIVGSLIDSGEGTISFGAENSPITVSDSATVNGNIAIFAKKSGETPQNLGNLVGDTSLNPNAFSIVNVEVSSLDPSGDEIMQMLSMSDIQTTWNSTGINLRFRTNCAWTLEITDGEWLSADRTGGCASGSVEMNTVRLSFGRNVSKNMRQASISISYGTHSEVLNLNVGQTGMPVLSTSDVTDDMFFSTCCARTTTSVQQGFDYDPEDDMVFFSQLNNAYRNYISWRPRVRLTTSAGVAACNMTLKYFSHGNNIYVEKDSSGERYVWIANHGCRSDEDGKYRDGQVLSRVKLESGKTVNSWDTDDNYYFGTHNIHASFDPENDRMALYSLSSEDDYNLSVYKLSEVLAAPEKVVTLKYEIVRGGMSSPDAEWRGRPEVKVHDCRDLEPVASFRYKYSDYGRSWQTICLKDDRVYFFLAYKTPNNGMAYQSVLDVLNFDGNFVKKDVLLPFSDNLVGLGRFGYADTEYTYLENEGMMIRDGVVYFMFSTQKNTDEIRRPLIFNFAADGL